MDTQDYRLILDIGTHKVLALAVKPAGDGVEVLASAFLRHSARSMRDGQVHDVEAVARTVRKAVDQVSEAVGVEFTGAHIAAAGRALQTARGGAERSEPHSVLITPEMTRALVWEAVADAQLQLLESLPPQEQQRGFYCIAHTVVESRLDGDVIGSLTGQRGRVFSVEVLATFLPGVVVDSLEAVLAQAGLAMHGLTLEPVAALEAVIPPTMRHLNLILVDIGAGTSDIALTGDGMVKAFAMVPRGGDAMTEAVSKKFLLDFHVAEQVKREAAAGRPAAVENVLGLPLTVAPEEAVAAMEDAMGLLVDDIARALEPWLRAAGREAAAPRALAAATPDTSAAAARRVGGRSVGGRSVGGLRDRCARGVGGRSARRDGGPPAGAGHRRGAARGRRQPHAGLAADPGPTPGRVRKPHRRAGPPGGARRVRRGTAGRRRRGHRIGHRAAGRAGQGNAAGAGAGQRTPGFPVPA